MPKPMYMAILSLTLPLGDHFSSTVGQEALVTDHRVCSHRPRPASDLNRLMSGRPAKGRHSLPHRIGASESVFRRILQLADQGGSSNEQCPNQPQPLSITMGTTRPRRWSPRPVEPNQAAVKTTGPLRRHAFRRRARRCSSLARSTVAGPFSRAAAALCCTCGAVEVRPARSWSSSTAKRSRSACRS